MKEQLAQMELERTERKASEAAAAAAAEGGGAGAASSSSSFGSSTSSGRTVIPPYNGTADIDGERDQQLKLQAATAAPPPKPVNEWQGSDSDDLDVPDGDESPQTEPEEALERAMPLTDSQKDAALEAAPPLSADVRNGIFIKYEHTSLNDDTEVTYILCYNTLPGRGRGRGRSGKSFSCEIKDSRSDCRHARLFVATCGMRVDEPHTEMEVFCHWHTLLSPYKLTMIYTSSTIQL